MEEVQPVMIVPAQAREQSSDYWVYIRTLPYTWRPVPGVTVAVDEEEAVIEESSAYCTDEDELPNDHAECLTTTIPNSKDRQIREQRKPRKVVRFLKRSWQK
jgi:hypothetical protein